MASCCRTYRRNRRGARRGLTSACSWRAQPSSVQLRLCARPLARSGRALPRPRTLRPQLKRDSLGCRRLLRLGARNASTSRHTHYGDPLSAGLAPDRARLGHIPRNTPLGCRGRRGSVPPFLDSVGRHRRGSVRPSSCGGRVGPHAAAAISPADCDLGRPRIHDGPSRGSSIRCVTSLHFRLDACSHSACRQCPSRRSLRYGNRGPGPPRTTSIVSRGYTAAA